MTDLSEILAGIEWSRMAAPQEDGYDTRALLRIAASSDSSSDRRHTTHDSETFCDSLVSVRPARAGGMMIDNILPAASDHPNLAIAGGYLARWPAAYEQFKRLVDTVYPYTDIVQASLGDWSLGSSSHSYEEECGSIHVTIDNALGLAQALIHEMAHLKLRLLGVSTTMAERLIINPCAERFNNPLNSGQRVTMTNVFHEQYTFIHVTALDLHLLARAETPHEKQLILMLLARNVPRMAAGYDQIFYHIQTDAVGRVFVEAFMDWSRGVLTQGQSQLDANGYGA